VTLSQTATEEPLCEGAEEVGSTQALTLHLVLRRDKTLMLHLVAVFVQSPCVSEPEKVRLGLAHSFSMRCKQLVKHPRQGLSLLLASLARPDDVAGVSRKVARRERRKRRLRCCLHRRIKQNHGGDHPRGSPVDRMLTALEQTPSDKEGIESRCVKRRIPSSRHGDPK
jgi:hypothetical protein